MACPCAKPIQCNSGHHYRTGPRFGGAALTGRQARFRKGSMLLPAFAHLGFPCTLITIRGAPYHVHMIDKYRLVPGSHGPISIHMDLSFLMTGDSAWR